MTCDQKKNPGTTTTAATTEVQQQLNHLDLYALDNSPPCEDENSPAIWRVTRNAEAAAMVCLLIFLVTVNAEAATMVCIVFGSACNADAARFWKSWNC